MPIVNLLPLPVNIVAAASNQIQENVLLKYSTEYIIVHCYM